MVDVTSISLYLQDLDYPCSKESLLDQVQEQSVPSSIFDTLQELPDRVFDDPADITEALQSIA